MPRIYHEAISYSVRAWLLLGSIFLQGDIGFELRVTPMFQNLYHLHKFCVSGALLNVVISRFPFHKQNSMPYVL